MKILFCNVTYLKYYDGRVDGELEPTTGGSWVDQYKDAHEKWNFLNMDGNCFGYVQVRGNQMHIERMDKVLRQSEEADDVTVVWCANHPSGKTYVVGWYEHATAYRHYRMMMTTPATGIDRDYWFKTKAEDAYLLPEEYRTFEIGRAAKTGTGTGFGRENFWYAESKYARENVIPQVLQFIEKNRDKRINILTEEFKPPKSMEPLSKSEERRYQELIRNQELDDDSLKKYLTFSYRKYANEENADYAYSIAASLIMLHQYKMSIPWFEKTIALDSDDKPTRETLVYVYQQCEEFEKSKALALELLEQAGEETPEYRDELYSAIADDCCFMGDIEEGISWLDRIIEESEDAELIEYTKGTKKDLLTLVE